MTTSKEKHQDYASQYEVFRRTLHLIALALLAKKEKREGRIGYQIQILLDLVIVEYPDFRYQLLRVQVMRLKVRPHGLEFGHQQAPRWGENRTSEPTV
jgi:hypothetical protein